MNAPSRETIRRYEACKNKIKVTPRTLAVFEYRAGMTDGTAHTQKQTGQKFGISANRVGQLEARIKYEVDSLAKTEVRQ